MITAVAEENEIMLLMLMMLMILTILIIIMFSNRSWFYHWQETLWIEIYRRLIILIKQMIVRHRCQTGCRGMMPRNTKCAVTWWHHTMDDVRAFGPLCEELKGKCVAQKWLCLSSLLCYCHCIRRNVPCTGTSFSDFSKNSQYFLK